MGRNILAVIAGYFAMAVILFVIFTAAYFGMGADRAFKETSYDVSTLWVAVSVIVGGAVCGLVSGRSRGATLSLMVLVLVLSVVSAGMALAKEKPVGEDAIRGPETSNTDAMMRAQQPSWFLVANPIIGVFGVMTGAMMVGAWRPKPVDQK